MPNYDKNDVLSAMSGKWEHALYELCGWDRNSFNTRKHGPCPVCGGKDRFRWGMNKSLAKDKGMGWCNNCGSHDGIWWFSEARKERMGDAINTLGEWLGGMTVEQKNHVAEQSRKMIRSVVRPSVRISHDIADEILNRNANRDDVYYFGVHELVDGVPEIRPCNVARISRDGKFLFAAGSIYKDGITSMTWGAVSRINVKNDGFIYLCEEPLDAIEIAGCIDREVWICFKVFNMLEVSERYKGKREIRFVTSGFDDLATLNKINTGRYCFGVSSLIHK
uniref:DNA primase n=2 Tax=unclassified Caudoviricetes TaxID=2788787 RepID=A0AB39AC51_9CAUD